MSHRSKPNRLYLYLLRPDGEPGAFQWIASANGFMPSLWRILLSDAVYNPSLQRTLLSGVDSWTAIEASVALARYRAFVTLALGHPGIDRVDGLRRYLAAADRYLSDSIAQWTIAGSAAPVFCVNLALLPDIDPATEQPVDNVAVLHSFRDALDRILRDRDVLAIEAVMGFPLRNLRFEDWKAWSGMFGLAQLEPDYFSGAFRRPFDGDYADHDYDELGSEADLVDGCYRFKDDGRWGVRTVDGDSVLDPQWDRVLKAGVDSLVWLQLDERFGLATIGREGSRILRAPDLDEVHAFVAGLARVRVGESMGLLSADGRWFLDPSMDEIHAYVYGHAVVRSHGRYGYIATNGRVVIEPSFDEADDFSAAGVARVRRDDYCGLIRSDGSFAMPLRYSSLDWSEEFSGWCGQRDGVWVIARANGSAWIDAGWNTIEVFIPGELIRVRRGDCYGLLRWDGTTLLDCEFDELLTRDTYGVGLISARKQRLVGLIGSKGEQLIPFEFAYIDALEPHNEDEQRLVKPELMRVLSVPGKAAPRVGVWDLMQGRCVVPCLYDFIWTTLFDVDGGYGFIVGNRNPKRGFHAKGRYRVGLLNADGSILVPQEYAWIAESTPLNRNDAMADLRSTIYHYWSRGEPVRASVNEHGPMVGLPPPSPTHESAIEQVEAHVNQQPESEQPGFQRQQ